MKTSSTPQLHRHLRCPLKLHRLCRTRRTRSGGRMLTACTQRRSLGWVVCCSPSFTKVRERKKERKREREREREKERKRERERDKERDTHTERSDFACILSCSIFNFLDLVSFSLLFTILSPFSLPQHAPRSSVWRLSADTGMLSRKWSIGSRAMSMQVHQVSLLYFRYSRGFYVRNVFLCIECFYRIDVFSHTFLSSSSAVFGVSYKRPTSQINFYSVSRNSCFFFPPNFVIRILQNLLTFVSFPLKSTKN